MTTFLLEELRQLILNKVGIRVVSPSDCALIALTISKELRKNISETTVKRLFGFAALNHQFSKFTINTLLEYVENEQIMDLALNDHLIKENEDWDYLSKKARILSEQTIKQIEQNCAIPFELTIERKFATHDFDYFYGSSYSFTTFVAQPGNGKSVMMSHLVKNYFLKPDQRYSKDAVLFLPASKVFDPTKDVQSLEQSLKKLLGVNSSQNLISYLNEHYKKNNRKLILIFDSFYEILHAKKQKNKIFDSIIQFLCDIDDSEAIKVVLTMRSYIWRRFFEAIRHSHYIKNKWYTGSYFRFNEQSNIPVFTDTEITQLLKKIHPSDEIVLSNEMKSLFKTPYHFQYYFQLKEEYPAHEFRSNLVFYELSLRYLRNNIYQTNHSVEKLIICRQLIQLSAKGKNGNKINKNLIINEFQLFRDAYMELMMDGILIEEHHNTNGFLTEWVRFVQPHIFDYFLYTDILENYQREMGKDFFSFLQQEYGEQERYLRLINWSIFHLVKKNEFNLASLVLDLGLPHSAQNEVLLFLVENIKHQLKVDPKAKIKLAAFNFHQEITKRLIHLDFLSPNYRQIFEVLSKLNPDEKTLAIYQSISVLLACLRFDREELQQRLLTLEKFQFTDDWEINPHEFGSFILLNLDGSDTSSHPLHEKLDPYYAEQNASIQTDKNEHSLPVLISKSYAVVLSWFVGNSTQVANVIDGIYESRFISNYKSNCYSAYMLHTLALSAEKLGSSEKSAQLERILFHMHHFELHPEMSEWCKGVYHLILAQSEFNKKNFIPALQEASESITYFDKQYNLALELMAYHLIIAIFMNLNDIDKVNEHRCTILNRLENKKVHTRLFDITSIQLTKNFSFSPS